MSKHGAEIMRERRRLAAWEADRPAREAREAECVAEMAARRTALVWWCHSVLALAVGLLAVAFGIVVVL